VDERRRLPPLVFLFLEAVTAFKASKAELLLDNASGHLTEMETDHVSVQGLPATMTAWNQPCDQEIINFILCIYRREMKGRVLVCADEQAAESLTETTELLASATPARCGALGVADGKSPHVFHAMKMLKQAFDHDTPSCTMRRWILARCLPSCVETEMLERLDAAPEVVDAPPDDEAHAIFGMSCSSQSTGSDGAAIGSHLLSGDDPDALPIIRGCLSFEDDRETLLAKVIEMTTSSSTN